MGTNWASDEEFLTALAKGRQLLQTGEGLRIREEAGLSLRFVGNRLDLCGETLRRWELGRFNPSTHGAAEYGRYMTIVEKSLRRR